MSTILNTIALVALLQGGAQAPVAQAPIAQAPGPQPAATQPAPAQQPLPAGVVTGAPTVEAPLPPQGVSSARYRRTTRVQPISRAGTDFEGRVSAPIRSLVGIRGMEENHVTGIGLVTGLAGTGDSGALATQMLANSLLAQNINIDPQLLATSNVAVVRVEGAIPPGAKAGQKLSIRVSAIGDADSLVGGVLDITELTDITGTQVYATAMGPVMVGGFSAQGDAASATKNHVTVGTLSGGGTVQRDIPTSVVSEQGYIYLDSKQGQSSLGNTVRIAEAINRLYPRTAVVLPDGKTVRVAVMDGVQKHEVVAYLDHALSLEIQTDNLARVIVNERTGVIVMGGNVRLRPGVVRHGTIVVTVADTPEVSQPGPFSSGNTVAVPRTNLEVVEGNGPLALLGGASSLEEVVEVLNVLGATPRDMISILDAMLEGGLLVAELRRI